MRNVKSRSFFRSMGMGRTSSLKHGWHDCELHQKVSPLTTHKYAHDTTLSFHFTCPHAQVWVDPASKKLPRNPRLVMQDSLSYPGKGLFNPKKNSDGTIPIDGHIAFYNADIPHFDILSKKQLDARYPVGNGKFIVCLRGDTMHSIPPPTYHRTHLGDSQPAQHPA